MLYDLPLGMLNRARVLQLLHDTPKKTLILQLVTSTNLARYSFFFDPVTAFFMCIVTVYYDEQHRGVYSHVAEVSVRAQ